MNVIVLRGAPGTGKTAVAGQIVRALPDWEYLSIDAIRATGGDWPDMTRRIKTLDHDLIVESVAQPNHFLAALKRHTTVCVVVGCDEGVRRERLRRRGDVPLPLRRYPKWQGVSISVDTTRAGPEDFSALAGTLVRHFETPRSRLSGW